MTREIDRAIDVDRQVGIDLDQAAIVALIPVVTAPRFVRDVLDRKRFAGGKLDMRQRPARHSAIARSKTAASRSGGMMNSLSKRVVARDQRTLARQQLSRAL